MIIRRTKRFDALYRHLPPDIQDRADKQLCLLLQNSQHPSLRLHKMRGYTNQWEISISLSYRIIFSREGDTYILEKIGTHDILEKP